MNTKQTLILYATDTFVLIVDFILMDYNIGGIDFAILLLLPIFGLPILAVAALMTLLSVILWKNPVQLSKDDIFFFVVYNTAIPYGCFSVALLLIMLVWQIF